MLHYPACGSAGGSGGSAGRLRLSGDWRRKRPCGCVRGRFTLMIPYGDGSGGTYNPDQWMEPKEQRKVDKFIVYATVFDLRGHLMMDDPADDPVPLHLAKLLDQHLLRDRRDRLLQLRKP